MPKRSAAMQTFLDALRSALENATDPGERAGLTVREIFASLETAKKLRRPTPNRLPVCDTLPVALAMAEREDRVAPVARAFARLEPKLAWWRRVGAEKVGAAFFDGHANATVVGKGGLEERSDAMIGVSFVAPNIDYPNHNHPPEEVYLVLSPGAWRRDGVAWHEPGIGGIVHNPPGVTHAMRSGDKPLLAVWCLKSGELG